MILHPADMEHFDKVRTRLFAAIDKCVERGERGKVYEGTFEITFPNYFHDHEDQWAIKLHCYLIGPGRHYEWFGSTLSCAIDAAAKDIDAWIAEDAADNTEATP